LINAVEYAINLEESQVIMPESLPPRLRESKEKRAMSLSSHDGIKSLEQLEKEAISHALEVYGWTEEGKKKAAIMLGISRATIYRKISKYDLVQVNEGE